jgi:tetratricopeptide (TPR) repeat protein
VVVLAAILMLAVLHARNPARFVDLGRIAIAEKDPLKFDRALAKLRRNGSHDHARMIQGEWHLAEARRGLEEWKSYRDRHALAWQAQNFLEIAGYAAAAPMGQRIFLVGALSDPQLVIRLPAFQGMLQLQVRVQGQLQLAYKEFTDIPVESPLFAEVAAPAGEALVRLREAGALVPLEGAYKLLRTAVEHQPDNADAHRWLAVVCGDLGLFDEALEEYQAVGRLDPADGRPFRQMGLLLQNQLRRGPAMEAYQEALHRELSPHVRAEAAEELAGLQISNGLVPEALRTLEKVPPAYGRRTEILALRAAALWVSDPERHQVEVAQLLDAALANDPDNVACLRLRARVHLAEDQLLKARPLLERAVQLAPHEHEARHLLAQILTSTGETAAAAEQRRLAEATTRLKRELDDLIRLAGRDLAADEPRLRAAQIYLELGNRQAAHLWVRAALACNPHNPTAKQLLDRLEGRASSASQAP